MGLFNRFKKKEKVVVKQEEVTIELSKLNEWLEREHSSDCDDARSKIKSMHTDIINSFGEIRASLKVLEAATFEKDDQRYTAANMIKDTFVNKTNKILNNESEIRELDNANLKTFYLNSIKNIRELTTISPKQTILLTSYFKEQTNGIISNVKQTETKLNELNKFLDSDGKIIWVMQKARDDSTTQNESIEKYADFRKQIESKEREIENLHKKIKKDSAKLDKLVKDSRWNDIEKLDGELYYTEKKVQEAEESLGQIIANVTKPLKKLDYAAAHGYSPGIGTRFIREFIETPLKALVGDDGVEKFKTILCLIRDGHKDKKVPLKPKDEEKILDLIRRCGSDLPLLAERYRKLSNELETKTNLRGSLHPEMIREKEELGVVIKKDRKETELLKKDIKYIEEDMKHLLQEINSRKSRLEKIISDYTKKKVMIAQSV